MDFKSFILENNIKKNNIKSRFVSEIMEYYALLPENYNENKKYPVLYLLHGITDRAEYWFEKAEILDKYKEIRNEKKIGDMILIFPESGNDGRSWYTNFERDKKSKYEDYFIKELIPDVEKKYSVYKSLKKRAIVGFSMGGYGAYALFMRNIDEFKVVGSFAGALNLNRLAFNKKELGVYKFLWLPDIFISDENGKSFEYSFGNFPIKWADKNPYKLIDKLYKEDKYKLKSKYFYLSVGKNDVEDYHMINQWQDMCEKLEKYKLNYNANLVENEEHTWEYVGRDFENLLLYVWGKLEVE